MPIPNPFRRQNSNLPAPRPGVRPPNLSEPTIAPPRSHAEEDGEVEVFAIPNPRRPDGNAPRPQPAPSEVGVLITPEDRHDFNRVVLHAETIADINAGLAQIQMREQLEQVWNISALQPMAGRVILNFYGSPGTGKTLSALCIARLLGKNLYQVDYSQVISKYMGDTAKHIKKAFARARAHDAVLFFDEADSLLSRRVDMGESCATSINQNRNTLMQELDRFDGVVIMTTNLFGNYDPALLRRVAKHIPFMLPNAEMRKKLFLLHLPNLDRVDADMQTVADAAQGLSGGDIFNVCLNSILASSVSANPAEWRIKQDTFLKEIEKVKSASTQNSTGRAPRVTRPAAAAPATLVPNVGNAESIAPAAAAAPTATPVVAPPAPAAEPAVPPSTNP